MEKRLLINRGEILLWNDIGQLRSLLNRIDQLFEEFPQIFEESMKLAEVIKSYLIDLEPFIDFYSKKVCSICTNICCLNKNSRYEYDDLIYILALREKFPIPERNLEEKESCYLLTERGCKIPRYLRPLRCNWYFCKELLLEMESAPARLFRSFSNKFTIMLNLRQQMLNSFFQSLSQIEVEIASSFLSSQ